MTTFKFRSPGEAQEILLDSLDTKLIIPNDQSDDPNDVIYFANGDRLCVNMATGEGVYDPVHPGEAFSSRIAMKFHQWFAKGLITEVKAA